MLLNLRLTSGANGGRSEPQLITPENRILGIADMSSKTVFLAGKVINFGLDPKSEKCDIQNLFAL